LPPPFPVFLPTPNHLSPRKLSPENSKFSRFYSLALSCLWQPSQLMQIIIRHHHHRIPS